MIQVRRIFKCLLFIVLFCLVISLSEVTENPLLKEGRLSATLLCFSSLLLILYFNVRVVGLTARRVLVSVAGLMLLLFMERFIKYNALLNEGSIAARYLWYAYYIPILGMAQLSLRASHCVGMNDSGKPPKFYFLTLFITVLLVSLVMTNDLHSLAYRITGLKADGNLRYSNGPLFYAVYAWLTILAVLSVICIMRRSTLPHKWSVLIPILVPYTIGTVPMVLSAMGKPLTLWGQHVMEMHECVAVMFGGCWMICLASGLIPSNKGYNRLFLSSSMPAAIRDQDGRMKFMSAGAAEHPLEKNEDTLLHEAAITGGSVLWSADVKEINAVNQRLEATREETLIENARLENENAMKIKQAEIRQQTLLYDEINRKIMPQTEKIGLLTAMAQDDPSLSKQNLKLICIYGAYIKRAANFLLLSHQDTAAGMEQLVLALQESARHLEKAGIRATVNAADCSGRVWVENMIFAYDLFEELLEKALPTLTGFYAVIEDGALRMTYEGAELTTGRKNVHIENDDGTCFVRVSVLEGGVMS